MLESLLVLGNKASNDLDVAHSMQYKELNTIQRKRTALRAQEMLRAYLSSSNIDMYVNTLMAFNLDENGHGFAVQGVNAVNFTTADPQRARQSDLFAQLEQSGQRWGVAAATSIVDGTDCIAYLSSIYNISISAYRGWLYIELSADWVTDLIDTQPPGSLYVVADGQRVFPSDGYPEVPDGLFPLSPDSRSLRQGDRVYKLHSVPLQLEPLALCSRSDITFLARDNRPVRFTVMVVMAMSLTVALVLTFVLSNVITRPLVRLCRRIEKIAGNDFRHDPQIELGGDEISDMGRMVNEMSGSIRHLLAETEEMYIQRKNSEIALLQSQVNPHFLYNTLDSIHWMATIQKNTGIMKVTRSLSRLLRNLAKGVGDKIPLGEELQLLGDYVEIQSVRYFETFRFVDGVDPRFHSLPIIKFTLQPLVENAIFHGIASTGCYGTVLVAAAEEGDDLLITVEDDGAGMAPEEIARLMATPRNPLPKGLCGMGVSNVDSRLKLTYGSRYGLTYDSQQGRYTRVTVRIPIEREHDGEPVPAQKGAP